MPEPTVCGPRARIGEYLRRVAGGPRPAEPAALRPPAKLYRASEVANYLGITRQTLHNYATIGLITEETRTPGGQRLFDEGVFARLAHIQRLKGTHRLHEIRRLLASDPAGGRPPAIPAPLTWPVPLAGGAPAAPADAAFPTELFATHDPVGDGVGPDFAARAPHEKETRRLEEPDS